jgi:hypothetical protein
MLDIYVGVYVNSEFHSGICSPSINGQVVSTCGLYLEGHRFKAW